MNEGRSEECACYILAILKKFNAHAGYVLFDPDSRPEFTGLIRSGDFAKGIEYAIDKKWLIKERSKMWRLTMTGFTKISNGSL